MDGECCEAESDGRSDGDFEERKDGERSDSDREGCNEAVSEG